MGMKDIYLAEFRKQWKAMLQERFRDDLDKLRQANMVEFAKEMLQTPVISLVCKPVGIDANDLEKILVEVRNEICKEVTNV